MSTSANINPVNLLTANPARTEAARSNKQEGQTVSELPFGQILKREVSERRNATEKKEQRSASNDKTAASAAASQAAATEAKSAAKAQSGPGKKEVRDSEDSENVEHSNSVPADLLSLVASINQLAATITDDGAETPTETPLQSDPSAIRGKGKASVGELPEFAVHSKLHEQPDSQRENIDAESLAATFGELRNSKAPMQASLEMTHEANNAAASGNFAERLTTSALNLSAPANDIGASFNDTQTSALSPTQLPIQVALNGVRGTEAMPLETLAPRVGTPAWDQSVGQKVVWMVAGAQQSATLSLNPPELGPLQIVLNVNNSQANATFVAAQPEVRQALEAAMPKLREMLGEAGIQLGQANVNAGTSQHNAFDQRQQHSSSSLSAQDSESAPTPTQTIPQRAKGGIGMVDTFA